MEQKLLKNFCEANLNTTVTLFLTNGFQLRGRLLRFDDTHVELETREYGNDNDGGPKTVLLSHAAISTYVPGRTGK